MGRLLLHADGILAEFWILRAGATIRQPPDRWDAPHVAHRFAEAFSTLIKEGRLVPSGPAGGSTPPGRRYQVPEWEDLLDDARRRRPYVRVHSSAQIA